MRLENGRKYNVFYQENSVIIKIMLGLHHGEHPVLPNPLCEMTLALQIDSASC